MSLLTFILDFDGTICDTRDAISSSLVHAFETAGIAKPDNSSVHHLIGTGKTLQETIHALHPAGGSLSDADMAHWMKTYRTAYRQFGEEKVHLFATVMETLTLLKNHANLILLSNKGMAAIEHSLERLSIKDHFDLVLGEEPDMPKKPEAAVYDVRILPRFPELSREHCIVVGDTEADLQFAKNIGAIGCWAAYGFGDHANCEQLGYDHKLTKFSDLTRFIN
ncbi:HAD family hydrolase [Massilia sp. PAMC28688]|uniref:HAD family hydrolase n=1 Tax=Massilia sp. PAMC28688 TaxID=2861283 RepID=UPI001C634132|nr:HAD family hydrolase [Massilia sp. PAMC28688]QYF94325.1 HAD family hydrolase [Massilia sp. PAMC28688]